MTSELGPNYLYSARLNRVVAGDAYVLDVDLGFRVTVSLTIRVDGIDSPDVDSADGAAAKEFATGLLTERHLVVKTVKDRRSFERWVGQLWVWTSHLGWVDVASAILHAGHAAAAQR